MQITSTFYKKVLLRACTAMFSALLGDAAFAADACAPASGSAPIIANYAFRSSYDISALAVGAVIDTVTATTTSDLTLSCPGATANQVVGGLLPGGGLATNVFGTNDTLLTRVAGVGVRIKSVATGNTMLPNPQMRFNRTGSIVTSFSITFVKISSETTGNDTVPESASATLGVGDNKMQAIRYVLSNAIQFIRGNVTTCVPTVVPSGAILLPKVSTSALSANGQTAGATSFSIQLSNCKTSGVTANGVAVRTFFDGPQVNAGTGNLNVTGTATNVQLRLTNGDGSVINLAGAHGGQNVATAQIGAGTASLPYAARYFATGKASPGTVTSTVNFTIEFP
jgi:major type 1 subunit fimbrin (pilin)